MKLGPDKRRREREAVEENENMLKEKSFLSSALRRSLPLLGLFAVVSVVFTHPIFRNFGNWGIQDWDVFLFFNAAPRVTLLEYHQFPLWNPWFCGGMPMLARPESPFLSPMWLMPLVFGVVHGMKILIALNLFIGLCGTYALARHYGLRRAASVLAASMYMLNTAYALTITAGMGWGLPLGFLPWAFLFYLRSLSRLAPPASSFPPSPRLRWAGQFQVLSSLSLLLIWFGGGPYLMMMALLLMAAHGFFSIISREQRFTQTTVTLVAILVLTVSLGAVKFFPAIEFTSQYPRVMNLYTGYSLNSLGYALFGRDQTLAAIHALPKGAGFLSGVSHSMDETGLYVGVLPAVLFLVGLLARARRHKGLALCFFVFLWLSFGVRIPVSLWNVLHKFPVFNIMRVAERFRFVFMLPAALFAGMGLEMAVAWGRRAWKTRKEHAATVMAWGVAVFVLADLTFVGSRVFKDAFRFPPQNLWPDRASSSSFVQTDMHVAMDGTGFAKPGVDTMYVSFSDHYPALLANQGIIFGWEEIPVPRNPIPIESPEYRGEVFLVGTEGNIRYKRWTPNRLTVEVEAAGSGRAVVNQNYYPGWKAKGGKRVGSLGGFMAVDVTPADRELVLYYSPRSFWIGLWVSLGTVIAVCAVWWRGRRKRLKLGEMVPRICHSEEA